MILVPKEIKIEMNFQLVCIFFSCIFFFFFFLFLLFSSFFFSTAVERRGAYRLA